MPAEIEEFEQIFLSGKSLLIPGKLRMAQSGLGFKPHYGATVTAIAPSEIKRAQFMRGCKGLMLRLQLGNSKVVRFDGFPLGGSNADENLETDLDLIKRQFKQWGIDVEMKELGVKGWNWGTTEFQGDSVWFDVGARPVVELPLQEVANTTMQGKNEVLMEFKLPLAADLELAGVNASKMDQLVECRFFIPDQ